MLDALRRGASGWIAQIFIAALVVSFAVWGVADVFTGFRSDTVAAVGRTDITIVDYQRRLDVAIRQFNQQYSQQLTLDQARTTGIPADVLGRLVGEATLNEAARQLGLGVSNQMLAQQIRDDPSFRGITGNFDRSYFTQLLNQAGLTEDAYMAELRASYVRQQITDALAGGARVPDAYMRALHEYRNEERSIAYVVLEPALAGTIGEPTDTDLTTYFSQHKQEYRAPEYRAVNILKMAPTDLARPDEVSDEDAKKAYDAKLTTYTKPEQRQVQQIVFADRAEADAAAAVLAGGKTFDDLIVERKLKPEDVDLGLVSRDKLIDPAVAEAAFALAANAASSVVDGRFGPVIVRVTTIEPETVTTFEQAKDELKKEVANRRAAAEIADQRDVVEDARAGGETLSEIAQKYGLNLITLAALDKSGADDKGEPIKDLPGGLPLVSAAFETDVGIDNEPLGIEGGFAWYEVTAVTAERDRELAEARDKVIVAWKRGQVEAKLAERANAIRDRVVAGEDIAKVAAEQSFEVKTAEKLTRATPPAGDLTTSVRTEAFAGPKGSVAIASGSSDQSKVVLVVKDAVVPPYFSGTAELAQSADQLSTQIGTDFLQQYVGELQATLGVTVNQTAIDQALGVLPMPGTTFLPGT